MEIKLERPKDFKWFKWLLLGLIIMSLHSCGTRKRTVNRVDYSKRMVDNSRFDSIMSLYKNIDKTTRFDELTIEPMIIHDTIRDTIYTEPKYIYRTKVEKSVVTVRDTVYVSKQKDIVLLDDRSEESIDLERKATPWYVWLVICLVLSFVFYRIMISKNR